MTDQLPPSIFNSAKRGDIDCLRNYLLDHSACDINTTGQNGNTILHIAARHGQEEIIEMLHQIAPELDRRLDPNIKNNEGNTALDVAETFFHIKSARVLRNYFYSPVTAGASPAPSATLAVVGQTSEHQTISSLPRFAANTENYKIYAHRGASAGEHAQGRGLSTLTARGMELLEKYSMEFETEKDRILMQKCRAVMEIEVCDSREIANTERATTQRLKDYLMTMEMELETAKSTIKQRETDLKEGLSYYQEQVIAVTSNHDETRAALQESRDELARFTAAIAEHDDLVALVAQLTTDLDLMTKAKEEAQKAADVAEKLRQEVNHLSGMVELSVSLPKKIEDMQERLTKQFNMNRDLKEELEEKVEEIKRFRGLEGELASAQGTVETCQKKILALEHTIIQHEGSLADAELKFQDKVSEVDDLEVTILEMKNLLDATEDRVAELEKKLVDKICDMEALEAEKDKKTKALQDKFFESKETLRVLEEEKAALYNVVDDRVVTEKTMQKEMAETKSKLDERVQQVAQLICKLEDQQKKVVLLKVQLNQITTHNDIVEKEIEKQRGLAQEAHEKAAMMEARAAAALALDKDAQLVVVLDELETTKEHLLRTRQILAEQSKKTAEVTVGQVAELEQVKAKLASTEEELVRTGQTLADQTKLLSERSTGKAPDTSAERSWSWESGEALANKLKEAKAALAEAERYKPEMERYKAEVESLREGASARQNAPTAEQSGSRLREQYEAKMKQLETQHQKEVEEMRDRETALRSELVKAADERVKAVQKSTEAFKELYEIEIEELRQEMSKERAKIQEEMSRTQTRLG
uniref:Uncharacterized protein n=1 Tax=Pyramimonas obovata TaxID=1411642 RepID=A0A7S0RBG7_9CHLO|mmetsp:Transcript_303/g.688  ORF Transcript_303/g.688 Transcript_303/m.688 type:complete len:818 (+) Transcript_303:148-2601(+)|eukprot:CAMPEP_0118922854 /NCGR_PEP_ID=MMETSP1169-20130426/1622_1 /TAXON_ID=36882 /ORGANISM="Pyramimonas obovata, Strain CCMP722" /LENGTH=817 /DNA_ID=CAMNT_0006863781 /DNA_START=148 /DNA_END=2601 /DNA_ORIENTATION=+